MYLDAAIVTHVEIFGMFYYRGRSNDKITPTLRGPKLKLYDPKLRLKVDPC